MVEYGSLSVVRNGLLTAELKGKVEDRPLESCALDVTYDPTSGTLVRSMLADACGIY